MDEKTLRQFLHDYFYGFEILSYIKDGKYCFANIKCNIQCQYHVDDFIKFYSR